MKKLILVVLILITLIFSVSSCSSFSSSTTLLIDSAQVSGFKFDKQTSFDIKDIK